MVKVRKSNFAKLSHYLKKYPTQFISGPNKTLYCNICATCVSIERKCNIKKHVNTKKHKNGLHS